MTEADDLKERLLAMYSHRCDGLPTQYVNPDGPDAAARIATQQEAIDELVAGIAQIAKSAEQAGAWPPHRMSASIEGIEKVARALLSKRGERT